MKYTSESADRFLSKEDYEEPCCPLSQPSSVTPIPTGRVIEKLDEYLGRDDYDAAERHLRYWLNEAESGNDARGRLTVLNEQIGLYRKMGIEAEGTQAIRKALSLVESLGLGDSVTGGTTLVNAATGYKAFGKPDQALPLYQKAREIYEALLQPLDEKLGGLYNNMALTLVALGRYDEAKALYETAIDIMSHQPYGEAEMAISYCNLADLVAAQHGIAESEDEINRYLTKAETLLHSEALPHNGYYAFVCEKCAPTFGYYGFFRAEQDFSKRAREIYERA